MTRESLAEAIRNSSSVAQVAAKFRERNAVIYRRIKEWGLSLDELQRAEDEGPPPEEIAARAAEVRKGWSPKEERRRAGAYAPQPVSIRAYGYRPKTGVALEVSCAD
jgi:hypothetical protein